MNHFDVNHHRSGFLQSSEFFHAQRFIARSILVGSSQGEFSEFSHAPRTILNEISKKSNELKYVSIMTGTNHRKAYIGTWRKCVQAHTKEKPSSHVGFLSLFGFFGVAAFLLTNSRMIIQLFTNLTDNLISSDDRRWKIRMNGRPLSSLPQTTTNDA